MTLTASSASAIGSRSCRIIPASRSRSSIFMTSSRMDASPAAGRSREAVESEELMRIILRHFFLALLPLVFGIAAGWGFAFSVPSCGRLVGPVFGPKCHWKQLEYQIQFHMAGVAFGCLLAATLGATMELRRLRAVQRATPTEGAS